MSYAMTAEDLLSVDWDANPPPAARRPPHAPAVSKRCTSAPSDECGAYATQPWKPRAEPPFGEAAEHLASRR